MDIKQDINSTHLLLFASSFANNSEDRQMSLKASTPTKAAHKAAPGQAGYGEMLLTVFIIVIWYVANIGLLLLNKVLLGNYGWKFACFMTLLHMVSCSMLSYVAVLMGVFKRQLIQSQKQLIKVALVGLIFCWSLVLGNTSLRYIPISFNQAIGSTTPFFTAIFSIAMTRKVETRAVYLTLVPVVAGICIASGFEPSFHLVGFTCCLLATAARAFKSVLQGILLLDETEKLDSMNLLMYMSPIASLALLPTMWIFEPNAVQLTIEKAQSSPGFMYVLLLNVLLAYFVNLLNFLVTRHTSALTLQVLGNAKGVIAAGVSVLIFKNRLTGLGVMGYAITVSGVFAYSEAKRRQRLTDKAAADKEPGLTPRHPEVLPLLRETDGKISAA